MNKGRLRSSEWVLIAFFAYVTAIAPLFRERPHLKYQPILILLLVTTLLASLAWAETRFDKPISMFRDWLPMALTLLAFR